MKTARIPQEAHIKLGPAIDGNILFFNTLIIGKLQNAKEQK